MIQLDIYCGLITGSDDNAASIALNAETARGLALDWFPHGHTIIEATGRWDEGGVPVTEPTLIIRLILDDRLAGVENRARNLAGSYKALARQESVMIIKTNVDASFV